MSELAKRRKPVKGTQTLYIIGIKWKNQNHHASSSQCRRLGTQINNFYKRNSRGLLNFNIKAFRVKVPYNAAKKNLNKAESYCKRKHPGADKYAIVHSLKKKGSNAGGNTAHLSSTLGSTGCHEIGHLLSLEHSGVYKYVKNKANYKAYGDRQSVMGAFASGLLAVPQYYWMGWLFQNECAQYDYEDGSEKIYTLRRIMSLNDKENLAAVRIPIPGGKRDAFVGITNGSKKGKTAVVLYLTTRGGSQKVTIPFGSEYYDKRFTGLLIKKIEQKGDLTTISIKKEGSASKLMDVDYEKHDEEVDLLSKRVD